MFALAFVFQYLLQILDSNLILKFAKKESLRAKYSYSFPTVLLNVKEGSIVFPTLSFAWFLYRDFMCVAIDTALFDTKQCKKIQLNIRLMKKILLTTKITSMYIKWCDFRLTKLRIYHFLIYSVWYIIIKLSLKSME